MKCLLTPASVLVLGLVILQENKGFAKGASISKDKRVEAFYYFLEYGYIAKNENEGVAALMSDDVITKAVKDFQVFAGLNPSGELDDETVELMNTPRCGVKDNVGPSDNAKRKKRYALQGSRWTKDTLDWRISKYPTTSRYSKSEIEEQIKKAFDVWSKHTKLKFNKKKSGSAHIDIRFERKEHGDGDPFDGPGGTLAHAFFPQYGGDAHFDDDEYWTIDMFSGTNLLQTAAHEFGHSLGLSHSDVRSALMAPFYKGWEPNLKLDRDDIDAIQALYGGPDSSNGNADKDTDPGKPNKKPKPDDSKDGDTDNVDLCSGGSIDDIFGTEDGNYYVFKGGKYWKMTDDSLAKGYPRRISDDWPGVPNNIDAAVTWTENKKTYIFKDDQYWKFENQIPEKGYPKKISEGFDGIPNKLDAAFVWGGNGKIYFMKGDDYWKFDPSRKPPVRSVYPRNINNWDLPSNINGAVQWKNKRTYFFKDDEYYRFNDRRFQIDSGDPKFPRSTGPWWFGCEKPQSPLRDTFSLQNDSPAIFSLRGLTKQDVALTTFDLVDELLELDVIPADE